MVEFHTSIRYVHRTQLSVLLAVSVQVHVAPNGSNGVLLTFSDESTMELNDVAFQAHNSLFEAIASNDKGAVGPLVSQFLDMLDNVRFTTHVFAMLTKWWVPLPAKLPCCWMDRGLTASLCNTTGCEAEVPGQYVQPVRPHRKATTVFQVHDPEGARRHVQVLHDANARCVTLYSMRCLATYLPLSIHIYGFKCF